MTHDTELRWIEEFGLTSSIPPGQLVYDGWLLRLLPGQAKRARSVNRWVNAVGARQLYAGYGLRERYRYWYRGHSD